MTTAAEAALAVERAYADHQDEKPVLKYDAGKAPVWRGVIAYFPRALQYLARVSEFGASKYSWGAWAKVETPDREDRYADALVRHLTEMGKDGMYSIDPETGRMHVEHLAWNALALIELYARKVEGQKLVQVEPVNGWDVVNDTAPR